ncbi:EKC/KEOPS complex subunit Tprkb-like [Orussus abietinus]|uniref:EKC/KEOPS complex subunit Tprkb-like n=1 Tax=Orussus abietinus TaxID=222816 RepID=UPI000625C781|nr:EKC/KEOPS complex subunit Tprkb-like [Orussus abietinus]
MTDSKSDCWTMKLDDETGKSMTLHLFKDVENTPVILKKLHANELPCCILKAALIADPFQVAVAANKAAVAEKLTGLTTKTLYTEILFNLSPSKNISQSLQKFGIDDKETNVIVATIHDGSENPELAQILNEIKGSRLPISKLNAFTDIQLIKKTYKLDDSELEVSNIMDSIVSRISTKDFSSYK